MSNKATLSAVAVLALAVAGCATSTDDSNGATSTTPPPPDKPHYSYVWSAEDGIDLFGRPAELVRAAEEATTASHFYGPRAFPGFADALGPDAPADLSRFVPTALKTPETRYTHIAVLDASNETITADVCAYSVPAEEADRQVWARLDEVIRIELTNSASLPGEPGVADPSEADADPGATGFPKWNVFGTWKISDIHDIDELDEDKPAACTDWWLERFPTFSKSSPDRAGVVPPPNFVSPVEPLRTPYPEWFGPAER